MIRGLSIRHWLALCGSIWAAGALAGSPGSPGSSAVAEPLSLYFFERPPYVVHRPGSNDVTGLTATPAAQAFRAAGITFQWVMLPTVRQLVTMRDNSAHPACAVGWFKNPDRELHFKFTKPIYRDRPTVGLAPADFDLYRTTLAETLRQPGLKVLVKDGFSYGPLIDGLLAQAKVERVVTSAESVPMIHMIAAHRAHFMFAAEEEAAYLVEQAGVPAAQLRVLHFADLPPGERRHILCSKGVPDESIERLNKAITVELP